MLELNGITKSYGTHRVLDDVSFTVAPGRMTGFVVVLPGMAAPSPSAARG